MPFFADGSSFYRFRWGVRALAGGYVLLLPIGALPSRRAALLVGFIVVGMALMASARVHALVPMRERWPRLLMVVGGLAALASLAVFQGMRGRGSLTLFCFGVVVALASASLVGLLAWWWALGRWYGSSLASNAACAIGAIGIAALCLTVYIAERIVLHPGSAATAGTLSKGLLYGFVLAALAAALIMLAAIVNVAILLRRERGRLYPTDL